MWQNSPKVLTKIFSKFHLEHGMWWRGERSRGNCLSTFGSNSNLSNMWLLLFNFWLLMKIWKDMLRQCWWDEITFHKFYAEIEGEGGRVGAFLWILIHIWTSSTNWCSPESKQGSLFETNKFNWTVKFSPWASGVVHLKMPCFKSFNVGYWWGGVKAILGHL